MKYICSTCGEIYRYMPNVVSLIDCPKVSCKGKIIDVEEILIPIVQEFRKCSCTVKSIGLKGIEDIKETIGNSVVFDSVSITVKLELMSGREITDSFIGSLVEIILDGYTVKVEEPFIFMMEKEIIVEPNSEYRVSNSVNLMCILVSELHSWLNIRFKEFMKFYDVSWCEGEEDSEDMDRSIVNDEEECSFRD